MELEFEEQQKQRQDEYKMRKLELESSRLTLSASAPLQPPPFRVDAAVKLIPKFTEYDVETFLISFEKMAKLNAFPPDKYAAVLQAHLTGKALKVFTELPVEECCDYSTLKAALLDTYSVVPEVYRKRFRTLTKSHAETYSEFVFRLNTQFTRGIESEDAHSDITLLRDVIQCEQFNASFGWYTRSLRLWQRLLGLLISLWWFVKQSALLLRVLTGNRNQLLSLVLGKPVLASIILRRPILL